MFGDFVVDYNCSNCYWYSKQPFKSSQTHTICLDSPRTISLWNRTSNYTNSWPSRCWPVGEAGKTRTDWNSFLDFQTNHVAILDMSLRSGNSQQQQNRYMLVCFVLDLDRQNIGDLDELLKAAKAGANKLNQLHGWEQNWQFIGIPLNQPPLFQPEIGECRGARWVQLSKTSGDQKSQKCSECFDFCLPDWGIQKDVVRDENYLNILRQICFSLFVPEWRPFAQAPLGGQQKGQIDLYNGQQPNNLMTDLSGKLNAGPTETKWISLQTPINNGLIVDQNRLPSLSNSAFSSPLQFSTNQEQMSPIIGQQSHSTNW